MFIDMKKYRATLLHFFLLFHFLFFGQAACAQAENDANNTSDSGSAEHVIAHPDVQNSELSLNQLRSIFSLRARQWPDGTSITVFVLRDEKEVHRQFLLKTLKMLPHQLRRQWDRYIYAGIGQGPVVVESQEEMLNKVKSTPGGIGYIEGGVPDDQVLMLSIR